MMLTLQNMEKIILIDSHVKTSARIHSLQSEFIALSIFDRIHWTSGRVLKGSRVFQCSNIIYILPHFGDSFPLISHISLKTKNG